MIDGIYHYEQSRHCKANSHSQQIVIPNLFRNLYWNRENLKQVQVDEYKWENLKQVQVDVYKEERLKQAQVDMDNSHSEEIVVPNSEVIAKCVAIAKEIVIPSSQPGSQENLKLAFRSSL